MSSKARADSGRLRAAWGDPVDEGAVRQIHACMADGTGAVGGVLMADHHLGYSMPVGGVVAYEDRISPSGVGYDIACGNKAVRVGLTAAEVRPRIAGLMDEIWETISFGIGRRNKEPVEHPLFDDDPAWSIDAAAGLRSLARGQLGTVGAGNHYVDVFADEEDRIWIGVHFGSRGLGHRLATHFMRLGGGSDDFHAPPVLFAVDSRAGEEYRACMELAGRYAYAGRDWVCERVCGILGSPALEEVHNHHNFAWLEEHEGRKVWVVRKGATPAFPGQRGFIGGSMGDVSVIVEGVDTEEAARGVPLHRARRRPGHVAHRRRRTRALEEREGRPQEARGRQGGSDQPPHDGGLGPRLGGGAARRRHRRVAPLLQAAAGGAGAPRRLGPGAAHAQAAGRGHGRTRDPRPLPGLASRPVW